MRNSYRLIFFIFFFFIVNRTFAQSGYAVSGTITDEKGEPIKGATVFIGGSQRVMPTDENGKFNFVSLPSGTFQLSVQMIGYAPQTRSIIVKSSPINIELQLIAKSIRLEEVVIGKKSAWDKNFKLFKKNFLGESENAKQCFIANPKVINFSTKKGLLLADAEDFLIIENRRLGYLIHYQLKDFGYNTVDDIALYHGECSFEELPGTDEQKKQWAKNRLATYRGSFMHFLRSVYDNNTLENGFIAKSVEGYGTFKFEGTTTQLPDRMIVRDRPVTFDSLITALDTNFISFKFRQQLYVIYDPSMAARFNSNRSNLRQGIAMDPNGSVLRLATNQSIIDKKGSYTDYRDFFIQGYWAKARVSDQLPVEYQPPVTQIPRKNIAVNSPLALLRKWTDSIPQEKVYLHMNKPYYITGDTIWFKGYLTTGSRHQLSSLSGAVYIDLINEQNQFVKTLKLPVDSGTVAGDLILGADVKAGSYHIRAYTQWMRNVGEDYFFDRIFTIGKPITEQNKKEARPDLQQADVQFFPESGNLVNGIISKVGFKVIGSDGLGIAVNGNVTDNDNEEVAHMSTQHAGMGSFLLRPLPEKTYSANIKFTDGTIKTVKLPTAMSEGYVLSVYQPAKDSLLVRIQASASLQHSTVTLIIHSNGEVFYAAPIDINGPITSIWLDKISFPSGVAQFTIFDTKNQALNERVAFIKSNDYMHLGIKTEKAVYKGKEHVQLALKAEDSKGVPIAANFSVAVIDENQVPADENAESTIFSNILLKSDIKGYIEKPNYYFMADTSDVNKALDNLMLTQGYRRFEWRCLDSIVNTQPAFKAEGLGTIISGRVTDLQHRILPDANILLVSTNAHIHKATTTDAKGRFKFENLMFADSAKFAIQARTKENSGNAIITLDSIPKSKINIKQNFADIAIIKQNLAKAEQAGTPANLTGLHVLKQVEIKATQQKKDDKTVAPQGMFSLPDDESADHILTIPDPERYPTLKMFLQARLSGIRIEADKQGRDIMIDMRPPSNMASNITQAVDNGIVPILNGRKLSSDEFTDIIEGGIQPEDIAKIEVVNHNQAMINFLRDPGTPPAGFLLILTKPATTRKHYDPNIVNITPKGYNKVRQFYSPRYDRPTLHNTQPDSRTTIYWNPYVNTDASGKATLDFYNADGPGTYRVVVEGIDAAGELGRTVYTYKIE